MTPIPFTLTEADVVAGNRLAIHRSSRKAAPKLVFWLLALTIGVTLFAYVMRPQPLDRVAQLFGQILAIYVGVAIVVGIIVLYWMPKQRARANMAQMRTLSRAQSVAWTNDTISFTADYGHATIPLADLRQWAADPEIIILYPADHLFYMIPRCAFEQQADWDNLMSVFEQSTVPRI